MSSALYFFLNPVMGIIKIGIAGNVDTRRRSLEHACGVVLETLKVVEGGEAMEKDLHLAFHATRLQGEWFTPSDELLALIDGDETVEAFLARKRPEIAARQQERADRMEAQRLADAEATRIEREELKRLALEAKRVKKEREAKREAARKAREREALERGRAAQAEWSKGTVTNRVLDTAKAAEAARRREFITRQRARNAALLGVSV